ncbi:cation:dicarboxylate symporter family transporter [Legionella sp. CNM-1927-20]|uniref:cation:dicarboxylate symporter family transporter n=1 Tax=Legionella sp. CNM-1927-20 TaxID=3422221 RepID=UPI00403AC5C0
MLFDLKKFKLLCVLLVVISFPLLAGQYIPTEIKSISYALSLSMKTILEFFMPFIIFSFVFSCLANLQKGAVFFVCLLITCVFISNFTALLVGYSAGCVGLDLFHFKAQATTTATQLLPAWQLHLKKLVPNDIALIIGFFTGIFFSLWPTSWSRQMGIVLNKIANNFLKKIFIPLLPVFILGFLFKLEYEQVLHTSLHLYGPILILIIATQWLYLGFWYLIASQGRLKQFLFYLKNILPATLTGLSTISSAAAMPVLLLSTEKNLNVEKARMLVPAIINIHTIGSAIGIPILALATLSTFHLPLPSLQTFIIFAFYTALAKYAVAAVPGGVIIVVAPILEAHLGFSNEMTGLITAIYLLCDPFGTAANVTGNGVFPILFTKFYEKVSNIKLPTALGARKTLVLTKN